MSFEFDKVKLYKIGVFFFSFSLPTSLTAQTAGHLTSNSVYSCGEIKATLAEGGSSAVAKALQGC